MDGLSAAAMRWYRRHRRALPWRQTRDPYAIWISEIMLQQTQVATVIPYYERFLKRFPNAASLAAAELDEVFVLWAGLGYYRRARQMHAAAREIVERFGGTFPERLEDVLSLPGIGRYTACAILSFAMDQRLGIVEANTQRIYARLLALEVPPQSSAGQKQLWAFADSVVPPKRCGDFNQAMMELGSQVCTPRSPDCLACPLRALCPSYRMGSVDRIPVPAPPKVYEEKTEATLLVRNSRGHWLLRRCGDRERWAGLWDFPRYDITACRSHPQVVRELSKAFQAQFGEAIQVGSSVYSLKHGVTRYRITLHCYEASLGGGRRSRSSAVESQWLPLESVEQLALNASCKRVLRWLTRGASPRDTR